MKRIILLIFFFTGAYLLKAQPDSNRVWAVKSSIQIDYYIGNNKLINFQIPQISIEIIKRKLLMSLA